MIWTNFATGTRIKTINFGPKRLMDFNPVVKNDDMRKYNLGRDVITVTLESAKSETSFKIFNNLKLNSNDCLRPGNSRRW